jgi:hypothetical protein
LGFGSGERQSDDVEHAELGRMDDIGGEIFEADRGCPGGKKL